MNKNKELSRSSTAERLRIAREMAGLSQAQVAKEIDLHRPAISEIEAGHRKVSVEELRKLSEIYGVSIAWLTDVSDETENIEQARIELAARELAKLKAEDLDRVLRILSILRYQEENTANE